MKMIVKISLKLWFLNFACGNKINRDIKRQSESLELQFMNPDFSEFDISYRFLQGNSILATYEALPSSTSNIVHILP